MDYQALQKTKVTQLREMAKQYPDVEGTVALSKEQLIDLLADKMGIEKPHKKVVGIDKGSIKAQIRELKKTRVEAIAAKDRAKMKETRHQLHRLRHKLRRAIKVTA